jgi:hypothetical protein
MESASFRFGIWGMAMDRCATLGRSDLAKVAWSVLGAVVGCSLAKKTNK